MKCRNSRLKRRQREQVESHLDARWRDYVRERDDWRCRRCGRKKERWSLEAHHVAKRRLMPTRWEPFNGLSLCKRCHTWVEEHPSEARDWACEEMGENLYDAVATYSGEIARFSIDDLEDMLSAFRRGAPMSKVADTLERAG